MPTFNQPAIRAYLGGSFDPIHYGHLQMADAVYQQLLPIAHTQHCALHLFFLPTARSPFKDNSSDPKHRLNMLNIALANTPFDVCEHELWQPPPVYSIDTVRWLRNQYPDDTIIFIMGADSVLSLPRWKQGLALTDYLHLWVFERHTSNEGHHSDLYQQLDPSLQAKTTFFIHDLKNIKKGLIYLDKQEIVQLSSSQIRQYIHNNQQLPHDKHDTAFIQNALPALVYDYACQHQLY